MQPSVPGADARRMIKIHKSTTCFDVEQAVLGAALTDEVACAEAVQWLKAEHFADHQHKHSEIFETIFALFSAGKAVSQITATQAGKHDPVYLAELTTRACLRSQVGHYARIIFEHWMKREAMLSAQKLLGRIGAGEDIFTALDEHQRTISGLEVGNAVDTRFSAAVSEALRDVAMWESGKRDDVVPSGIYSFDTAFGGFPASELTMLNGMSGAGKTALMVHIVRYLARLGGVLQEQGQKPGAVLVFSAEMTRRQIAHRIAQAEARVNIRRLKMHRASKGEYDHYSQVLGSTSGLPVHIDDTASPTLNYIAARCQQVLHSDGLWFVAVDYDEKLATGGRQVEEELRVSAIAQGMKDLAKRFRVPVLMLGQYKTVDRMWEKRPGDDMVRYSRKKFHESAMMLHWHWPKYWVDKGIDPVRTSIADYDPGFPNMGKLLCTKNREGYPAEFDLEFYPEYMLFVDPKEPRDPSQTVPEEPF